MNEMLLVLGILSISILLAFILKQLKAKKIITQESLNHVITTFGLSMSILKQMNISIIKQDNLVKITDIITRALEFCSVNFANSNNLYDNMKTFVYDNCKSVGINLTNEQEKIVNELIIISLNSSLIK
jgi:branched-subunit amino acid ABC-type transport system permease component